MATILVVDDEIGIRELISEILSDEGHVVLTAENAAAARAAQSTEALDLVLLDIWMPDTDGVTLLKEWAANGALTMPVIMMSGHATIDTAVEATRFGALDFLEKPIALQRLLGAVRSGLERGRLMRSLRAGGLSMRPNVPNGVAGMGISGAGVTNASLGHLSTPVALPGQRAVAPDMALSATKATLGQVMLSTQGSPIPPGVSHVQLDQPLRDARDQFERIYFEYHLVRENHSMTRVADRAGLERTHLYRKLKQLGVDLTRGGRRQGRTSAEVAPVTNGMGNSTPHREDASRAIAASTSSVSTSAVSTPSVSATSAPALANLAASTSHTA